MMNLDADQPMPGMPEPSPLTPAATDPRIPQLQGAASYHGIPIAALGEDADVFMALGHHTPEAAIAAMNSYAQHTLGWDDLLDEMHLSDWQEVLSEVKQRWAVLKTHCDGYPDGCNKNGDSVCPECAEIAEATWCLDLEASEDAERAFPVTVFEP